MGDAGHMTSSNYLQWGRVKWVWIEMLTQSWGAFTWLAHLTTEPHVIGKIRTVLPSRKLQKHLGKLSILNHPAALSHGFCFHPNATGRLQWDLWPWVSWAAGDGALRQHHGTYRITQCLPSAKGMLTAQTYALGYVWNEDQSAIHWVVLIPPFLKWLSFCGAVLEEPLCQAEYSDEVVKPLLRSSHLS